MPISALTFARSTAALLLAGLATLLVIVAGTLWLAFDTQQSADDIVAARRIRAAIVELRTLMQDAEIGQRGFLLTREEAYLAPYERARQGITAALARLREVVPTADEQAGANRLAEIVAAKMPELDATIEQARRGDIEEAIATVRTDRGKALMDEARAIFSNLLDATEIRLNKQMARQQSGITAFKWLTLFGAILIVAVVGGSAALVARYTRELISTRAGMLTLNAGLEARVAERTAELAQANSEIQRFAYIVSHDLRSPLVNIMGFTTEIEALRTDLLTVAAEAGALAETLEPIRKDFEEALVFIRTSIDKMDRLIGAILKLSREGRRRLTRERVDMAALATAAAANIQHRVAEAGGEVMIDPNLPPILSDRLALEQVFGNLLDNAAKYGAPGRAPSIRVSGRREPKGLVYEVTDNGRGISAQDRERIFDLFRRAGRQDQPGEGIGLAHVRALVRRIGGDISVDSVPDRGTTFRISLPPDLPQRAVDGAG